jgi:hypothetical protein
MPITKKGQPTPAREGRPTTENRPLHNNPFSALFQAIRRVYNAVALSGLCALALSSLSILRLTRQVRR